MNFLKSYTRISIHLVSSLVQFFFNLLSIESFLVPSTKLCTELGGIAILDTKKKTEGKKRRILQMKSGRWDPMNKTNLFQRPLKSF